MSTESVSTCDKAPIILTATTADPEKHHEKVSQGKQIVNTAYFSVPFFEMQVFRIFLYIGNASVFKVSLCQFLIEFACEHFEMELHFMAINMKLSKVLIFFLCEHKRFCSCICLHIV